MHAQISVELSMYKYGKIYFDSLSTGEFLVLLGSNKVIVWESSAFNVDWNVLISDMCISIVCSIFSRTFNFGIDFVIALNT